MKDDKFGYLIPHFEEVRGGVEPWLMAGWKAVYDILFAIIMVALWNRADHYILLLWFVLFFPRLISAAPDWMSAILPHMVWP